jgi:hypothetical protein
MVELAQVDPELAEELAAFPTQGDRRLSRQRRSPAEILARLNQAIGTPDGPAAAEAAPAPVDQAEGSVGGDSTDGPPPAATGRGRRTRAPKRDADSASVVQSELPAPPAEPEGPSPDAVATPAAKPPRRRAESVRVRAKVPPLRVEALADLAPRSSANGGGTNGAVAESVAVQMPKPARPSRAKKTEAPASSNGRGTNGAAIESAAVESTKSARPSRATKAEAPGSSNGRGINGAAVESVAVEAPKPAGRSRAKPTGATAPNGGPPAAGIELVASEAPKRVRPSRAKKTEAPPVD